MPGGPTGPGQPQPHDTQSGPGGPGGPGQLQGPGGPGQPQPPICDHNDSGPIQIGYAIVTPVAATTGGIVVFETFGLKRADGTTQAAILPSEMTTNAMLFVNKHGGLSRDVGLGLVNPSAIPASITLTLRGSDGSTLATKTISVAAGQHTSQLVTELFSDNSSVPSDLIGTLRITSTTPIAIVGMRFRGLDFSTLPITNLSGAMPVPLVKPGAGGPGAVLLSQFAAGGGWESEVVVMNSGSAPVNVELDLFKSDGTSLTTRLNGKESSSFTGTVPANGVLVFAPRDTDGNSRF